MIVIWDEIERVLGRTVVARLQEAVRETYVLVGRHPDPAQAEAAFDALLASLAAAAIIKPDGARSAADRAETCCQLLRGIVAGAAKAGSGDQKKLN